MIRFLVSSAFACIFLFDPSFVLAAHDPTEKIPADIDSIEEAVASIPKFESTSTGPVLLRYKFNAGERVWVNFSTLLNNNIFDGRRTVNVNMIMTMKGNYQVKSVQPNGDAEAVMTVTHMTLETKGPSKLSFDSKDAGASADPTFKGLMELIDLPVRVKVSATGKVIDMDEEALNQVMMKAGATANILDIKKTCNEFAESSFIQLSEGPVKAGDIYDAGTIVKKMGNGGKCTINIKYKVLSISEDQNRAILQPSGTFAITTRPEDKNKVRLNSGDIDGWILFDLKKGNIVKSAGISRMDINIDQGNRSIRLETDNKAVFSLTIPDSHVLDEEATTEHKAESRVANKSTLVNKILEDFRIRRISDKGRTKLENAFDISLKNNWFAKWYSNMSEISTAKIMDEPTKFADIYIVNDTAVYNYSIFYYPAQNQMVLFIKAFLEDTSENIIADFKKLKNKPEYMKFSETDTYAYYGKKKSYIDSIYHTSDKSGLVQIINMLVIDI